MILLQLQYMFWEHCTYCVNSIIFNITILCSLFFVMWTTPAISIGGGSGVTNDISFTILSNTWKLFYTHLISWFVFISVWFYYIHHYPKPQQQKYDKTFSLHKHLSLDFEFELGGWIQHCQGKDISTNRPTQCHICSNLLQKLTDVCAIFPPKGMLVP